jgi:uncharacterized protein (DUF362 family)
MSTSVAIVKGKNGRDLDDVRKMMTRLFDLIGPSSKLIPKGSQVLIKVNLTSEDKLWDKGILTSPLFTQALVEEVQKARPAEVVIAEGTAVGQNTKKAFAANGYPDVAKATGARLLDLYDGEYEEVKTAPDGILKTVRISREVLKADFFINAPVLKTHFASTLTAAMKNLKGTTTYDEKKRFHYLNLNQAVAELNQVLKPNLIVIDGTIAMEGDGPIAGTPMDLNMVMGGTDAVAIDTICARIMGIDPEEVAPIVWAKKMGFGFYDEKDIRVLGNTIAEVFRPFKRSCAPLKIDSRKIEFIDGQACNACRDGLRIALQRLKASGADLDKLPEVKISLGSKASLDDSHGCVQVPIGNCQNQYKGLPNFVPGCPPPTFLMADEIREMLGEKRKFGPKSAFIMD